MTESTGGGPHVLLVEDNPGDVRLVEEAFRDGETGARLHAVSDGRAALDVLRGRGEHADAPRPDLVLLDLNLPRVNGEDVLAELKDDPDLRTVPVVVLTSSRDRADVVRAYERHANAYMTKPVDPAEFIESIRAVERFWLGIAEVPDRPD
ncbi:response regulator [Halovivax sp.]|uniref:response regulator n=1 Tax=Halovivax sp. TaxID=1935978 RepID=UPI0025C54212|nr:response regulator [Halovivax sp.]